MTDEHDQAVPDEIEVDDLPDEPTDVPASVVDAHEPAHDAD